MSPKIQVLPLNYLCLNVISNQLIYALSDEEGKYYDVIEKYFSSATYEVLQDLLKIILNSVNLDASIRYACLEVLLREDVKKLDTGIFPQFYYRNILSTIALKGKRLQQLNLKGVWVRDYPEQLCSMIKRLKCLKTLVIPHMADDTVIEAILGLKRLTVLDICGEACYTVGGIGRLQSDTIRVLDIGNFGKIDLCQEELSGYELVAGLIEKLPNLTSIRTYSYTGSALWLLYDKNPKYKTKLSYLRDTGTTLDIMESIIKLCPGLESIHIDTPQRGVLEKLSDLKKLNSLKLVKANMEEVLNYLRVSGGQLQVLKLNHNKNVSLDLSQICLDVPNLQTLECFQMQLTFTNSSTYFMSLQNVELLYCDTSDHVLRYILTNSPFLKRIVVGCVVNMTDGDIFRLCAECDFRNLEELWFSCARCLTATSVELLMGHCPNLRVIGQLNGWDMHQDELDYLRAVIAATNTDLTLLPVGNFL
ncbi:hypothetical protein NQ315_011534 [Exocentrus adspersus]|uniref:F-box/LRR-repeat protein 2 n=1 Tax=Exocentrus adspersus TaxID=1586481 RepID=A0AAV8VUM9_9CUCU|nr:hypothetical protein NQ315_011534 [Exocentrus adspersus]